jgi:hypothetical protein
MRFLRSCTVREDTLRTYTIDGAQMCFTPYIAVSANMYTQTNVYTIAAADCVSTGECHVATVELVPKLAVSFTYEALPDITSFTSSLVVCDGFCRTYATMT